ncbi:hypothetical protein JT358_13185 [Micrococcales bacterium 31B]|nr:hypothetical protein [Micrococcales bacterium 31B]
MRPARRRGHAKGAHDGISGPSVRQVFWPRLRFAAASAALSAAFLTGGAGTASAAAQGELAALTPGRVTDVGDGSVLVSEDNVAFRALNRVPLFDESLRMVPGDLITKRIWLRNGGPEAARVRLDLENFSTTSFALGQSLLLTASAGETSGTPVRLDLAGGDCRTVLSGGHLDPGDTLALDLTVTMDPAETRVPRAADGGSTSASFTIAAALSSLDAPDYTCNGEPIEPSTPPTTETPEAPTSPETPEPSPTGSPTGTPVAPSPGPNSGGDAGGAPRVVDAAQLAPYLPTWVRPAPLWLARTGQDAVALGGSAAVALALGGLLVFVARRRQRDD